MPGGNDYLAGLGPPPKGLSAADMMAPAPIIHPMAGGFGRGGPITPEISKFIRSNYPQGFGKDWQSALFSIMNATGYKPPNASSPQNQWYQNGMWGGPAGGAGNIYNPGVANYTKPTDPINATIARATQTPFTPSGSQDPAVNAALMQNNARMAGPTPTAPPPAPYQAPAPITDWAAYFASLQSGAHGVGMGH